MIKRFAILATAAAMLATPAWADDNDDWTFQLNNTSSVAATSFSTQLPDGGWSSNWFSTPLAPDDSAEMTFDNNGDTRCSVPTKIGFADGSSFNTTVNYCGLDALIATDKTLYTK